MNGEEPGPKQHCPDEVDAAPAQFKIVPGSVIQGYVVETLFVV